MSLSRSMSVLGLAAVLAGCGVSTNPGLLNRTANGMSAQSASQARSVVRIHFNSQAELSALDKAGIDLFENVDREAGTVGATLTAQTEAILKKMGAKYEITQTAAQLSARSRFPSGYQTVDQVYADMKAMADAHADIAHLVEIGKSLEGRSLLALNVTSKPNSGLPAVRINSGQHARELPTVELTSRLMHTLTEGYGKDGHITDLVNGRDIWIVPIVNPDGRVRVQGGESMWRKNARKLSFGANGVDTNRNADDHWAGGDNMQWADDYHGKAPFSEPESQAVRDLCVKMHFKASLDVHNYAGMVLWPPGYDESHTKDEATFMKIGTGLADHLHYKRGTIATTIYETFGDLSTWEYDQFNTLAFACELADSGFDAPISEMQRDWNDWQPNFLYLIDAAGNPNARNPAAQSLMPTPLI